MGRIYTYFCVSYVILLAPLALLIALLQLSGLVDFRSQTEKFLEEQAEQDKINGVKRRDFSRTFALLCDAERQDDTERIERIKTELRRYKDMGYFFYPDQLLKISDQLLENPQ